MPLALKPVLKSILPEIVVSYLRAPVSYLKPRMTHYSIGDQPWMDEASSPIFLQMLQDCRFYLEYGSGATTVCAARQGKPFLSADTDRFFLNAVRNKIGTLAPGQQLMCIDIGLTGLWGVPVFRSRTPRRVAKWHRYFDTPWSSIDPANPPDLVLVDGRFRVATALFNGLRLAGRSDSSIVVDDYQSRPWYYEIQRHLPLEAIHGRMAFFRPPSEVTSALCETIEQFSSDWR